jgi:hypothetical protein
MGIIYLVDDLNVRISCHKMTKRRTSDLYIRGLLVNYNLLCNIRLLFLPFILGPLACFESEIICNYGSYRQSVRLFG